MRQWPVQDAKAHFSEFLETCLSDGPQIVSRRGEPKAILVSLDAWEDLNRRAVKGAKAALLAEEPRFELEIPSRDQWIWRDPAGIEE